MLRRVLTLGRWTAVESLRERLLYVVLLFAALLVGSSCILTPLAPGAQIKVVADLGLACIDVLGVLVILLSGAGLVRREIDRRSLDLILCKPVSRLEYLLGKWLGLVSTLLILTVAMTLVFAVTLQLSGFGWHARYLQAVAGSTLGLLVVSSLAVFFSTFTSPTLAALFTLALFVAGHLSGRILQLVGHGAAEQLLTWMRWVVPALDVFDLRGDVVHGVPVAPDRLLGAAAYAGLYALATLYVASLVFRRRELR
jgi:ABC-type transport system involved in multi-copper enzyme maturation permease subunit